MLIFQFSTRSNDAVVCGYGGVRLHLGLAQRREACVSRDADTHDRGRRESYPVGIHFGAEPREGLEPLIERSVVPEIRLGAAEAAVAGTDRERQTLVPAGGGAGVVRCRSAAADLVQAVTGPGAEVVE